MVMLPLIFFCFFGCCTKNGCFISEPDKVHHRTGFKIVISLTQNMLDIASVWKEFILCAVGSILVQHDRF